MLLQQCLPFTVLKQHLFCRLQYAYRYVATVLTVYGIETFSTLFTFNSLYSLQQCLPFTVLKLNFCSNFFFCYLSVATVLTVYGIETLVYEIY